jgi:molybdenum cofactor cytidylyltransferase
MASDASNQLRVAAILLAGGESSRMGESKALLPWITDEPLVAYHVHALHEAGYGPIVVVLGYAPEEIENALPDDVKTIAVVNRHYQSGRSSSIITGVQMVAAQDVDAFVVASVDQPRTVEMLRALREAWEREQPFIVIPSYQHRSGHPPLFDIAMMTEILQITEEEQGLREVIRNYADDRLFINVEDPLALANLNTWEDYEVALKAAKDQR